MNRRPLIVAHRGASYDAPENTLAAFRLAFEQGADAIEGDFHLTADGELVCIHDPTTKRCGDREFVVAKSTLAELRTVDVGSWKSPEFAGERVPTLGEVLDVVPAGKDIFIELKSGVALVPAVAQAIKASGVSREQIRLISFDSETIASCRSALPNMATSWLVSYRRDASGRWSPDLATVLSKLAECGADGLGTHANAEVVTPQFAAAVRGAGASLHAWTIDDTALAAKFESLGVESITTNRPALFAGR